MNDLIGVSTLEKYGKAERRKRGEWRRENIYACQVCLMEASIGSASLGLCYECCNMGVDTLDAKLSECQAEKWAGSLPTAAKTIASVKSKFLSLIEGDNCVLCGGRFD